MSSDLPEKGISVANVSQEAGIQCEIGLTIKEEKSFSKELNRLAEENRKLREKLPKKEMTIESLEGDDDTVKYFMGLTDFLTMLEVFNLV